ncbi:hypothetical protein [Lentimicrobium sp. S6]|uniref:hypothetical protein n=1 Tax=Lentimicrobium sp. S6 TaxID=2735872 RepID=UPI0015546560|nr:hypothetical protein [Lentimicrobium sp. S6]NPD45125.1 hypothetical protein [Lentimicrobium sp. S6]
MTQKILSIFLVMAFMSYQSYHTLVYINYYVNYDYFVNVLCENKDNPEKPACNGKCHLNKQLDQQKPAQEEHPFSKTVAPIFYPEIIAILLQGENQSFEHINGGSHHCLSPPQIAQPFLDNIFHPPKMLV